MKKVLIILGIGISILGCKSTESNNATSNFSMANDSINLYAFIGQKIAVVEFDPNENNERREIDSLTGETIIYTRYTMGFGFNAKYRLLHNVYNQLDSDTIEFVVYDHYGRPGFESYDQVLLYISLDPESGVYYHQKYLFDPVKLHRNRVWKGQDGKSIEQLFNEKKNGVLKAREIFGQKIIEKDTIPAIDSLTLTSDPYQEPWADTLRPIIIDAYGPNEIDWEEMVKDKRVIGIIHKATQGLRVDSKYMDRRATAKKLGYKWGSYHLGMPGKPVEQATFYLNTLEDSENEILALDLEGLDGNKFMGLEEAKLFIQTIYEKTSRYPMLYCNDLVFKKITRDYPNDSLFSKCPLWYARFRKEISSFGTATWKTYTLWQFSSEINCQKTGTCLYNVPGTKYDMDINVYNGTIEDAMKNWPNL